MTFEEDTDEDRRRTILISILRQHLTSLLPGDRRNTTKVSHNGSEYLEGDRTYIPTGPGNEGYIRFPRFFLPCRGRNGIEGSFLVSRQKSKPVDFPGVLLVLVALVEPEDMVARNGSVPPDCFQLRKEI